MPKILVIEDEAALREEVLEWLTFENYTVVSASNGLEGVDKALVQQPDLIVCDIAMPLLDGYGVLLKLRLTASTATTPFIFLTARTAREDIRRGMELGADDYLTKPFSRLELLHAIEARLNKKARQELELRQQLESLQENLVKEKEQGLMRARVVAMISHDFRNPLTVILSSNMLLREYADRLDEKERLQHLDQIEASAYQIMQMIEDMMVVSQMEIGNLRFTPEPIFAGLYLGKVVEELQLIHSDTHSFLLEESYNQTINLDPRLFRQIAVNLISNAVKYSGRGSVVKISWTKEANIAVLTVKDTGIGIPKEDLQRIFEAFERGSNVGYRKGTGLGLAIVKQAVDMHSGSIEITSEAGVGTTVKIKFPIK